MAFQTISPQHSVSYAWNGVLRRPLMPANGQTVNGEMIVIPRGARTMTIHVPDLVGAGTTLALQSLSPNIGADGTETWDSVRALVSDDEASLPPVDAYVLIDAIPEADVTILPDWAFGAGIVRFVASASQAATPVHIPVIFGF